MFRPSRLHLHTGCSSVWWSAWLGTRRLQVRILSLRRRYLISRKWKKISEAKYILWGRSLSWESACFASRRSGVQVSSVPLISGCLFSLPWETTASFHINIWGHNSVGRASAQQGRWEFESPWFPLQEFAAGAAHRQVYRLPRPGRRVSQGTRRKAPSRSPSPAFRMPSWRNRQRSCFVISRFPVRIRMTALYADIVQWKGHRVANAEIPVRPWLPASMLP